MTRLLRHTLCALALLTLAACSKEEPGYNPPALADRTLLLYMPGRELLKYYEQNIEGIRAAVTNEVPGSGRILVCYQPQGNGSALLSEIYFDRNRQRSETRQLKTYDDFRAGRRADVQQLFADAAKIAPARRYGLIIGCHGKAWVPASSGTIPRSMPRSTDDVWTTAPGAKKTRSFGDPGYELDITELAGALEVQPFRFDYLLFDDCFMANIETLYDLRDAVDYVVASPCEVMSDGFPYERLIPHLFEGGGVMQGLEKVCREFWNLYQNEYLNTTWKEQSGCISLAVMSELDALATEMRRVKDHKRSFDIDALQYYKGGRTKLFYDLGHYVELCCSDQGVTDDFIGQLEKAFPASCRLHTETFYSAYDRGNHPVHTYWGVSVSEPSTTYAAENRQTSWYRATH